MKILRLAVRWRDACAMTSLLLLATLTGTAVLLHDTGADRAIIVALTVPVGVAAADNNLSLGGEPHVHPHGPRVVALPKQKRPHPQDDARRMRPTRVSSRPHLLPGPRPLPTQ